MYDIRIDDLDKKDIQRFSEALIENWKWKVMKEKNELWKDIIK